MTADDFALFPSLNTVELTGKREGDTEGDDVNWKIGGRRREGEGDGFEEEGRRRDWKWLHPE